MSLNSLLNPAEYLFFFLGLKYYKPGSRSRMSLNSLLNPAEYLIPESREEKYGLKKSSISYYISFTNPVRPRKAMI